MKKLFVTSLFLASSFFAFTQTVVNRTNCDNYNSFLKGENLQVIEPFIDVIAPSGIFKFEPNIAENIDEFSDIYQYWALDENVTFSPVLTKNSLYQPEKVITRYQQYYNGIEVIGAGYSMSGGGTNPCDLADASVTPYVANNIGVGIVPTISVDNVPNLVLTFLDNPEILVTDLSVSSDLKIGSISNEGCSYKLIYDVIYTNEGLHNCWIDA